MKRRNPFPGVTRAPDRHGKVRWRFRQRKGNIDTYLTGAYGSTEFRAGYEAAKEGAKIGSKETRAEYGALSWLIEKYLGSPKHRNKADSTRRVLLRELDWLREVAGRYQITDFRAKHVEALMAKKDGPAAANKVRKNLSMLFNYGIKIEAMSSNPVRASDKMKENEDGFYTWTVQDMNQFLAHHRAGSKARLIFLLALNTGAARQDLAAMTRGNINGEYISYRRGKTGVGGEYKISQDLAEELSHLPVDQMMLIAHGQRGLPYKPETLASRFKQYCLDACLPQCSLHGIRKGQATRLVDEAGTPDEVMAYLAHKTNAEGITYTKKADRKRLIKRALDRVESVNKDEKLSNQAKRLGKKNAN